MAESTSYILAAAGIVTLNEAIFIPSIEGKTLFTSFNWRIIPATALAAVALAGLEQLSEPLGKGLAVLALLSVLLYPVGNAGSPIDNAYSFLKKSQGK